MAWLKTLFVLSALTKGWNCVSFADAPKVLTTRAGVYKGTVRELDVFGETKTVEKYLGVPYAEPAERFQRSVVKAPMEMDAVYDATEYKPSCSQLDVPLYGGRKPDMNMETSENCLYLNIHKPVGETAGKGLAVMVLFHGGGYVCGSPQLYHGDMLSAYGDVIFISVAYRLAVFGFLSTGDEHLPGNLGLWDQHTALTWIHKYIADFGGDPGKVTIIGHSAGSGSAIIQSLNPRNKGLFRRVIGLSGSPTGPWSFQPKPRDITRRFASLLGCSVESAKEMVQCLKTKTTNEIHAVLNDRENGYITFPMELVPVVDKEVLVSNPYDIISHDSVLSQESKDMFASVDFMTGITSGEGAMNIHPFAGVFNTFDFALTREEFEHQSVPEAARIMFGDNVPEIVADMIIHEYTNWSNPEDIDNIRQSFLDMTGDYVFDFHSKLVADMHTNLSSSANGGKTFTYYFEAFPSQHILEVPTWVSKPNHGDELTFLYGHDKDGYLAWTAPYAEDYKPADWELETSKLFMTLLTNFAKTG